MGEGVPCPSDACVYNYIMQEFLDFQFRDENSTDDGQSEKITQKKIFDYRKDAELIYASFFAVYKLDLFELQGKLHWKKFQALMMHLDDNSPFKQVIGYRTMKVPTEKEATKEYIQHVRKMKRIYALEESSPEEQMNNAFDSLARTLKSGAKVVKPDG
jgi:hypothetical protein